MSNPIIYDGETHREMTDAEHAEWQALVAKIDAEKQAIANKTAARKAVLDKLGLTADEAAALLG